MKSLEYLVVFSVVLAADVIAEHTETSPANNAVLDRPVEQHRRVKRLSAPYSPRVFFPGNYYAQPWLHPQYAPSPIDDVSGPLTSVRRLRRGTTSPNQPPYQRHQQQRYSIWDLSRRRRRRSAATDVDAAQPIRHKRQIELYDGGNALTAGFALDDRRPRYPLRSPGIEPSYYHAGNTYTAWDLSRRRRRRRRQVLSGIDASGAFSVGNDDSFAQSADTGRRHTAGADRLPQYTIWDLVRRRRSIKKQLATGN